MRAVSRRATTLTWLALLALTLASFALSYAHLGAFGTPVALGIAALKVSLVATVFMELWTEPFTVRATLIIAIVFVALLAFFLAADVVTREVPPLLPPLPPPPAA